MNLENWITRETPLSSIDSIQQVKFALDNPIVEDLKNSNLPFSIIVLLAVPTSIIIFLTIFGNLLVLCFKAKVGRTNTTLLVWNLGLSDFLVGCIVLPLGAIHLFHRKWIFGRIFCRIWVATDVTFCTCSVVDFYY